MRIFIAGGGGMLGEAFLRVFGSRHTVQCTDLHPEGERIGKLDFRDFREYERQVLEWKPDFLFHLGAHTDLEYCEKNQADAYATNTMAVENAVVISNTLDIPMLYISTAGIFDGKKDVFDDWDEPNPMGVYARSKFMGERFVAENSRRFFVCRAGWMMGGGPAKDKKFIRKLSDQIASGKRTLHIVRDRLGTPTYTDDFAANVEALTRTPHYGVYNMVCEGSTSRLEVAREFLRLLDLEKDIGIVEVDSFHFASTYFAPRPESERLINSKLSLRGLNMMRDWRTCLREYVDAHYRTLTEQVKIG